MSKAYNWGDGKGKKHSISLGHHKKNVKTQRAAKANDPARFTAPRGATDVGRDANASANLRYGGQERELAQQQANAPAYYQQYLAHLKGINQGIQTGYQQAVGDVNSRAQQAQTTDNAGRAQLLAAAQKDAASRGASVDPNLFKADAGAGAVRRENQSGFANLLTSQGQAQNAYSGGMQVAGDAARIGEQQRIAKAQAGVASDKGAYKSQYVSDARDAERKNELTRAAFNLDTYKAESTTAGKQAQIKATSKNQAAQRKATSRSERNGVITSGPFAGLTHGQVRKLSPAEKQQKTNAYGKGKGQSPAAKQKATEKSAKQTTRIEDAENRWNLYKRQTVNGGKKPSPSMIKQRLIGEGFNTQEIHLALMWSSSKAWTAHDRAVAKRLGIRLPKKKGGKPAPKAPSLPSSGLLNPTD